MASVATRDAIAHYERQHNALLLAVSPGGILYDGKEREPFEALLVPREIALRVHALSPYLRLGAHGDARQDPSRTPPPPYGEHDRGLLPNQVEAEAAASASVSGSSEGASANAELKERLSRVTSAELQRIRAVMENFLRYHLLHFDGAGNSRFTTARGERGEFSDTLDSVRRFGRLGNPEVITDIDPLVGKDGRPTTKWLTATGGRGSRPGSPGAPQAWPLPSGASAFPPNHPATLQIYLIDSPLMDEQELRHLSHQLDSILKLRHTHSNASQSTLHNVDMRNVANAEPIISCDEKQRLPLVSPACLVRRDSTQSGPSPPKSPAGSQQLQTKKVLLLNGLRVEAGQPRRGGVMSAEEEEEDIVVEEDLSTYVSKSHRRALVQQEREQVQGHSQSGAAQPAAAVAVPNPPPAAASLSSVAPAPPPNLLNRQYSKESIKDYHRVVAADNDIRYKEFERLMEQKVCFPLVKLVSDFVTSAQMRGKGFKDSRSFRILTSAVQDEMERIPSIRDTKERQTIINEGIEKYVTSKLYFLFFNVDEHERHMNNLLQDKFHRLELMPAAQLDALPEVERHHVWGQAMFELDGMNFFKSPREKLRCGMRASELLSLAVGDILAARQRAKDAAAAAAAATATKTGTLAAPPPSYAEVTHGQQTQQQETYATTANQQKAGEPSQRRVVAFGADEFLPCFLLLVLRAQPCNFYQNIQYIDKFRGDNLRSMEESYCLTNMHSAACFWLNCDDSARLDNGGGSCTTSSLPAPPSAPQRTADTGATALANLMTAKALSPGARGTQKTIAQGTVVSVPVVREEDLLPSVRQASAIRCAPPPAAPPPAAPPAQQTPSLMDKLFDWVGQQVPASSVTSTAALASPNLPESGSNRRGELTSTPRPIFAMLGSTSTRRPEGAPPPTPPIKLPETREAADASAAGSRANPKASIYDLLVAQNKPFEELTEEELRAIVAEARLLAKN